MQDFEHLKCRLVHVDISPACELMNEGAIIAASKSLSASIMDIIMWYDFVLVGGSQC